MSTFDEIQAVLPKLSIDDLYRIERSIHELYRKRDARIIYDDSHGVWTEEDQASAGAATLPYKVKDIVAGKTRSPVNAK